MAAQDGVHLLDLRDVLELVEHDQGAEPTALLEAERQVEQRVQRREGVGPGAQLQPRADPERAEREAEPGALQELLDPRARLPLQLPRVRALEPDRDVRHREHAVEVDEDRDHPLLALRVPEHAAEQARLAVLPRRVEPDEVAADRRGEQPLRLVVAVDHVVGRDRVGVDEGVDVGDHGAEASYRMVPSVGTRRDVIPAPSGATSRYRQPEARLAARRSAMVFTSHSAKTAYAQPSRMSTR